MNPKATFRAVWSACIWLLSIWSLPSGAGFSGDAVIDTTMPYQYIIRAGGKHAGIARSNNLACNSVSADPIVEGTCPNDATYTPATATGGYQAWGVGLLPLYDEAGLQLECGYRPVIVYNGGDVSFDLQYVCWPVVGQQLSGYMGMAQWRLKWGEDLDGTSPVSSRPTSVIAFHPNTLMPCDPDIGVVSATCENDSDSSYVVNSGYEAEISFLDSACSLPLGYRTNTVADRLGNCFQYLTSTCLTNLPTPYRDTVLLDHQSVFIVSCGEANASNIEPGKMYDVRILFNSSGAANMINKVATHSGAITTRIPAAHPACLAGGGDIAYCFFSIDFASVGGPFQTSNKFSQVYVP